jgi:hypothetical protein
MPRCRLRLLVSAVFTSIIHPHLSITCDSVCSLQATITHCAALEDVHSVLELERARAEGRWGAMSDEFGLTRSRAEKDSVSQIHR